MVEANAQASWPHAALNRNNWIAGLKLSISTFNACPLIWLAACPQDSDDAAKNERNDPDQPSRGQVQIHSRSVHRVRGSKRDAGANDVCYLPLRHLPRARDKSTRLTIMIGASHFSTKA